MTHVGALDRYLSEAEWSVITAHRTIVPPRSHVDLPTSGRALVYVYTGEVVIERGNRAPAAPGAARTDARVTAGDLALVSAADTITMRTGGQTDVLVAHVDHDSKLSAHAALPDAMLIHDFAEREEPIAQLASALGCPVRERQPGDEIVCARIATTILTVAIRLWATQGCAPEGWPARVTDPFLGRAVTAIHDDLSRSWTVAALAEISAMSRSAFAARFRQTLGCSPWSYITTVRMERARDMLRDGRAVSEVSRALGFASDEGFRRAFRRETGSAPSQWRAADANTRPPIIATSPAPMPNTPTPRVSMMRPPIAAPIAIAS